MGQLKPSLGSIEVKGPIAFVAQSTTQAPSNLEEFRYEYGKLGTKLRESLKIEESWFDRWETLSIGERKRLQLACALIQDPDILLVDEPSNHVDYSTKLIILETLHSFKGLGILVSHDRMFLEELCNHTVFVEQRNLKIFNAPYSVAKEELEREFSGIKAKKEKLKSAEKKAKNAVRKQIESIDQKAKFLSKKNIAKKDHDAKNKVNLAKLTGADLKDSRRKKTLTEKQERLSEKVQTLKTKKTYKLGVFFDKEIKKVRLYLREKFIALSFLKIKQPEIFLQNEDKLAITGDNGAGKSTL